MVLLHLNTLEHRRNLQLMSLHFRYSLSHWGNRWERERSSMKKCQRRVFWYKVIQDFERKARLQSSTTQHTDMERERKRANNIREGMREKRMSDVFLFCDSINSLFRFFPHCQILLNPSKSRVSTLDLVWVESERVKNCSPFLPILCGTLRNPNTSLSNPLLSVSGTDLNLLESYWKPISDQQSKLW